MGKNERTRLQPFNEELEGSVLGALMMHSPDELPHMIQLGLNPKCFYKKQNRFVYEVILELQKKNEPIDPLSVAVVLRNNGKMAKVGGAYYLTELTDMVSMPSALPHHCRELIDLWKRRELIAKCEIYIDKAYEAPLDFIKCKDQLVELLSPPAIDGKVVFTSQEVAHEFIEIVDNPMEYHKYDIPTGFKELDELIYGLRPADMIVIAGDTSHGKTAFALDLTLSALKKDFPVLYFTMETQAKRIYSRLVSIIGKIPNSIFKQPRIADGDMKNINHYTALLADMPLFIVEKPSVDISFIEYVSKEQKAKNDIRMIVIDHLHRLNVEFGKDESTAHAYGQVVRRCKDLALELNVPVLLLSQFRRRENYKAIPTIHDLKESGNIENEADIVIILHRKRQYDKAADDIATVRIAKNRDGATPDLQLVFLEKFSSFADISIPNKPSKSTNPY